jgi:hypothetical protein
MAAQANIKFLYKALGQHVVPEFFGGPKSHFSQRYAYFN